jgi:hypothetical protein
MTRRLEDLKLLSAGLWEKLHACGFKVREMQKQLGLKSGGGQVQKLPPRYQYLAIEAFEQKLMSEGMLARFLGVDLLTARSIVENSKSGNMEEEDQAALSHIRDVLPLQEDEYDR